MIADPALKSPRPAAFPVAFRATPSVFEGHLSVHFIPQLPATASQHALIMTSCPTGELNTLLDTLAIERGVTFHGRFPSLPCALEPKKNNRWDAAAFEYAWLIWLAETPARLRVVVEAPYGWAKNINDQLTIAWMDS